MKIKGYLKDIRFYTDFVDPTVLYAEFTVPPMGANVTAYKLFVGIDDARLASYIRMCVLPNIEEKISVTDLLTNVKDTLLLGGNTDFASPRVRTAGALADGRIEYDLNNYDHNYVVVTPDGWKLTTKTKNKFLKRNTNGVQVVPQRTEKKLLSLLKPLVNTDSDSLILFAAWLVQAFCQGHHHALLVSAEQGCGKSTLTKMTQCIIDPFKGQPAVMPSKKDDLFTALSNSYLIAFDNTTVLSKEISDVLCSAITEATVAKRKLYTTNELGLYHLHNTLLLNGIDIAPTESDLASRCLMLKLKAISAEKRKTDTELDTLFRDSLPEILGAIFDVLSEAMSLIHQIKPNRLPRMASAFQEMLAIAVAMGVSQSRFEEIYNSNIAALARARADVAIVGAVVEYMQSPEVSGRMVSGTVTEVFNKIRANYSGCKTDIAENASHFSRKLRREYSVLFEAGYTVNFNDTGARGTKIEIIKNKT